MKKKRILVAPGVGPGHVMPLLAIAQELASLGHTVLFYAEASAAHHARAAGCRPVTLPDGDAAAGFRRCTTSAQVIRQYLRLAQNTAPDMLRVLREEACDLVITDALHLGAGLAAERSKLPWAAVATSPSLMSPAIRGAAQAKIPTSTLRRKLGLRPTSADSFKQAVSPRLLLLTWTPEFDLQRQPRQAFHVGPLSWAPSRGKAPAWLRNRKSRRPLVLAGVSTNTFDFLSDEVDQYVSETIRALNALPVDAVLTLGGDDYSVKEKPKRHVRLEQFVPHNLLMPHLAALVTHGGWGTVGHAMSHGVPMVIVPHCLDQPLNAQLCEKLGIAISLPLADVSAPALVAALEKLLQPKSAQRLAVQKLSARINRAPPAATAAQKVLELI